MLNAITDDGNTLRINHLVLDGASQWVIGRNVTSRANIENVGRRALVFPLEGKEDLISLVDHRFLSFIELSRFLPPTSSKCSSSINSVNSASTLSCFLAVSLGVLT